MMNRIVIFLITMSFLGCGEMQTSKIQPSLTSNEGMPIYSPPNVTLAPVTFSNKNIYQILVVCPFGASTLRYTVEGTTLSGTGSCGNSLYVTSLDASSLSDGNHLVRFESDIGQGFNGALVVDKTAPVVAVDPAAAVVSASGVSNYVVSGDCSEEGQPMQLALASFQTTLLCTGARYSTTLNLTPFAEGNLSVVISQQDRVGNQGMATTSILKDTLAPSSLTTVGAPAGVSTANTLNVQVGGTEVSHYRYLLGEAAILDCSNLPSYSAEIPVATKITNSLATYASGTSLQLCIIGRDSSGNWMNVGSTYSTLWLRQTDVEATISGLGATTYPSSSTATRTLTIGGMGVVAYKARTLKSNSCTGADFSGVAETTVTTPFYMQVNQGDGGYLTCVIGKRSDGTWQSSPTASEVLNIDTTGPIVIVSTLASNPTSVSPISYSVSFNETITGFTAGDIQVLNGTLSDFAGAGTFYSFNVSPLANGSVQVSIGASAVFDVAGNPSSPSNVVSRSFGTGFPTLTLASTSPERVASGFQVTAEFSAAISGFDSSDVVITNGILTGFSGSGSSFTLDVFPLVDGAVTVSVAADAAIDGGGLGNIASNTLSRIYDTIQPTLSLASSASNPTKNSPIVVELTFSETVSGLSADDFTVVNGNIGALTGSGAVYSLNITPIGHGNVSIFLPAGKVTDEVGLGNPASSVLERFFDIQQPTITVTTTASDPTNLGLIPFAIHFSETVTGFSAADISVTNGGIATFVGSGNDYQVEVSPASNGAVSLSISANVALDLAGNSNLASVPVSRNFDNIIPVVTILTPADGSYINFSNYRAFTVTGACSESTRSVDISGAVTASAICNAGAWSVNLDFFNASQGNNTITVSHRDQAGNYANSVNRQFVLDSVKPVVAVTSPAQNTLITAVNLTVFTVAGTCSEEGRQVTVAGDATGVTTCSSGAWSLVLDFSGAADGSVRITAAQSDLAVNTTTTAQYSFIKNTTGSAVTFSIDDIVTEEFGIAKFSVSISEAQEFDVTVDINAEEDTAFDETSYPTDHDFRQVTKTVTIPAGQTSAVLGVPVFSDSRDEADEDFWVRLLNPSVGSILKNLGRGTITKASITDVLAVNNRKARLDAGRYHTCFVNADSYLYCWGEGTSQQIGDNAGTKRVTPSRVATNSSYWSAVSAGGLHTCAIDRSDRIYCWGSNTYYQGKNTSYPDNSMDSNIKSVSSGLYHTCMLRNDGWLYCKGSNTHGQIGNNSTNQATSFVMPTGLTANIQAIAAGDTHSCALLNDKTVKCWGNNLNGQVGDGTNTQRLTPVDVAGLANVVMLTAGANHTCALMGDTTVRCWGNNAYGQLGDSTNTDRALATPIIGLNGVIDISAGDFSTCAVLNSGQIKCWGRNNFGQIGDGTYTDSNQTVTVSNITQAITVSVGGEHACTYTTENEVLCWGRNDTGQLGDGTTLGKASPVGIFDRGVDLKAVYINPSNIYVVKQDGSLLGLGGNPTSYSLGDGSSLQKTGFIPLSGLGSVQKISGSGTTCALDTANNLKCWGKNNLGQVGDGTTVDRLAPVSITGLGGIVKDISIRHAMGCAVVQTEVPSNIVQCWGRNNNGGLGNGNTSSVVPITVTGIINAKTVEVSTDSYSSACAILEDGTVKCWGYNGQGQLGDGTVSDRYTPVAVSGLSGVTSISGKYYHYCAVLSDQTVKCWGSNGYGQIGDGTTVTRYVPVTVSGLANIVKVSAGMSHSCALDDQGRVLCWGYNNTGQLGDKTNASRLTPVPVVGIRGAIDIDVDANYSCAIFKDRKPYCWGAPPFIGPPYYAEPTITPDFVEAKDYATYPQDVFELFQDVKEYTGGLDHQCVLKDGGSVECWGKNVVGQLGDGTYLDALSGTVQVLGLASVTNISAGDRHTCAATSTGAIYCWGDNANGQLGDGTTISRSSPILAIAAGALKVLAGSSHSCAIMAGGAMKCWGANSLGQLGLGHNSDAPLPQDVIGISGVTDGAAGFAHSCAVTGSAQIACWGYNYYGQLGNGTGTSTTAPVNVSGLTGVSKVFAGNHQSCALLTTGELRCWGYNGYSILGVGDANSKTTPVTVIPASTPVVSFGTSLTHSCAVLADKSIRCWGDNFDNALGLRSPSRRISTANASATVYNMSSGVTDVSMSIAGRICATTEAGGLKCWGITRK